MHLDQSETGVATDAVLPKVVDDSTKRRSWGKLLLFMDMLMANRGGAGIGPNPGPNLYLVLKLG